MKKTTAPALALILGLGTAQAEDFNLDADRGGEG